MSVAEDIVQDVYTTQWIHRASWHLRDSLSLMAYLRRAVYNRAIDVITQERKQHWVEPHIPTPPPVNDADHRVLSRELETIVLDIVGALPLRYRQVFLLCSVCKKPHREAAEALGLTPGTINYYLVAARHEIFCCLRERGFELPRWLTAPEMIFQRLAHPRRRGNSTRTSSAVITMSIDPDQCDPSSPFAGVTVDVQYPAR